MADIRVGTAGWTDKSLIASGWYPPEATTPEQRLRYYARQFPLVEVDSAYYALPPERNAAAWAERTPPVFTFNIKAFSLFTKHPTPVRALPADLREAAGKAGKDRVYLKDVDQPLVDQAWDRFLTALEPLLRIAGVGRVPAGVDQRLVGPPRRAHPDLTHAGSCPMAAARQTPRRPQRLGK